MPKRISSEQADYRWPRGTFRTVLADHIKKLGWTKDMLAKNSGISGSLISTWLKDQSSTRPISRFDINHLACSIAMGYGSRKVPGHGNLDGILSELLAAAGFNPLPSPNTDLKWEELSRRQKLTVGWVDYRHFSYKEGLPPRIAGVAAEIVTQLERLTGIEMLWNPEPSDWGSVMSDIRERRVDLIAPILLTLPSRLLWIEFSEPIPGIRLGINGLVHEDCFDELLMRDRQSGIGDERLLVNYVKGELGEAFWKILVPQAQVERIEGHENFEQAYHYLRDNPRRSPDKIRCLVADHSICHYWKNKDPQLRLLRGSETEASQGRTLHLPLAFGIHQEEHKLLWMINRCIRILQETDYFEQLFDSEDKDIKELRRLGLITTSNA